MVFVESTLDDPTFLKRFEASRKCAALLPDFAKLFRTEDFQERIRAAKENRLPVYLGR